MRYAADHKERVHTRILEAAGRLFCERGYNATGVDAVMEAAGLTAGAFYGHFASKDALLAETLDSVFARIRCAVGAELEGEPPVDWLRGFVCRYLSARHLSKPAEACPFVALGGEASRVGESSRATMERHLLATVDMLEAKIAALDDAGSSARDRAFAVLAVCVGGLLLARVVRTRKVADQVLRACRRVAASVVEAG